MDAEEKIREARLRRMARRQGLDLRKSRRRDPQALDYGGYHLIDPGSDSLIFGELAGQGFGASLDDIEAYLARPHADRHLDRAVSAGQSSTAVVRERVPVP